MASAAKWLELLKEIAPRMTRAVASFAIRASTAGIGSSARSKPRRHPWVEVIPINVRDAGEIERAVAAFAR